MACFIVPATEAVVVTVVKKVQEKKEAKLVESGHLPEAEESTARIPMSRKLKWLTSLLWGGVILLAFEHLWHGEITPWFPFLTAAGDPEEFTQMLTEMATVGVAMAVLTTIVWAVLCKVADYIVKRPVADTKGESAQ